MEKKIQVKNKKKEMTRDQGDRSLIFFSKKFVNSHNKLNPSLHAMCRITTRNMAV